MKNAIMNKPIRTGLLTAALAGGTILGATQVGGIVNAQTDDTTTEDPNDDDPTRQDRREARREARQESMQEIADLIGVEVDVLGDWLRGGGTLAAVATENGVEPGAVIDLMVANANERIDAAAENGGIGADEVAEKQAEAQERITSLVNEGRPERPGREGRQERRQESAQEMADLIGVEVEALTDWLRNGGTLAEIAEQNDVAPEAVVELIVENMTERIDQAVENGRIAAEDVDEALAEVEERATTRVNEGRPERGEGGFGERGDRGPRGGGGAPADVPATDDAEG
jgi:transcriptional regulator with XRE-family HTH domain